MPKLTESERLIFLDVLRLVAAVQMIQGHSVAAVLASEYRHGPAYALWTFARGLTSVLFLTTAGLAYVLAERRAHDGSARRRRCWRAVRLLLIGYAMHAPFAVVLGALLAPALERAVIVDVLQCIGVSLLGLELLTLLVRESRARAAMAFALGALCFSCAPFTHRLAFAGLELLYGNYLTARYGSLFPLLPWAGYVFLGFALGNFAFAARARAPLWLCGAGVLSLGSGLLGLRFGPALPAALSPAYAATKLGCVLLLAGALAGLLRDVGPLPSSLARLASQTLFLYVSHVLVLYADRVGLAALLGAVHGPLFGLGLALVLLIACAAAALAWPALVRSLRGAERGSTRGAQLP